MRSRMALEHLYRELGYRGVLPSTPRPRVASALDQVAIRTAGDTPPMEGEHLDEVEAEFRRNPEGTLRKMQQAPAISLERTHICRWTARCAGGNLDTRC